MEFGTQAERQENILEYLDKHQVSKQCDVVEFLAQKGFAVTQSSVSRDFADLGVHKVNGVYRVTGGSNLLTDQILGARRAGPHLLVLATKVGAAQLLGVQLDQLHLTEIVGTISGDDTIFVATESAAAQEALLKRIGFDHE